MQEGRGVWEKLNVRERAPAAMSDVPCASVQLLVSAQVLVDGLRAIDFG